MLPSTNVVGDQKDVAGGWMMINITEEKNRLLERYRHFRAIGRDLNNSLLGRLSKDTLTECGEKLSFFVDGKLVFETEDESSVLMDYCLYDGWSGDHNVITQLSVVATWCSQEISNHERA